jgi:hypothetical protein
MVPLLREPLLGVQVHLDVTGAGPVPGEVRFGVLRACTRGRGSEAVGEDRFHPGALAVRPGVLHPTIDPDPAVVVALSPVCLATRHCRVFGYAVDRCRGVAAGCGVCGAWGSAEGYYSEKETKHKQTPGYWVNETGLHVQLIHQHASFHQTKCEFWNSTGRISPILLVMIGSLFLSHLPLQWPHKPKK